MSRTDAELIAACRDGETQAFDALYHRHRDWVASVAQRFCPQREDALDVLQDTFAYLVGRIPDLELRHQLRTLLYPVIKHLARDLRIKNARGHPAAGQTVAESSLDELPDDRLMPGLNDEAQELIAVLGPLQQEIVTLRILDGLALQEIADALEIPLGTAKSRLHNALSQLREKLDGE